MRTGPMPPMLHAEATHCFALLMVSFRSAAGIHYHNRYKSILLPLQQAIDLLTVRPPLLSPSTPKHQKGEKVGCHHHTGSLSFENQNVIVKRDRRIY